MKKLSKKLILPLLVTCSVMGVAGVTACKKVRVPNNKPTGEYSFENITEPNAETDTGIVVDGAFSESIYATEQTKWYDYTLEMTTGYEIRIRMAVRLGEKGIYFAVDVDDPQVNFDPANRITYNSGMELMFSAGHETNAVGKAYRYSFSAGGQTQWCIFKQPVNSTDGNTYANWDSPYGFAPRSVTKLKGGEIGSGCTGYTSEIFIPNEAIGLKQSPENVSVFLGAITSIKTTSGGNSGRVWKGANSVQTGNKAGWDRPDTWFQFDKDGFVCNKVEVEKNAGGNAEVNYDYTVNGMGNVLTIIPEEGYQILSVKQDGKEVAGKLVTEEGVSRFAFTGAGKDTKFVVQFAELSTEIYTLSGELSAGSFAGAPTQDELLSDIASISLQSATTSYEAVLNGAAYSITAPSGTYTLKVTSNRGFTLVSKQFVLGSDITENIVLDEEAWSGVRFVEMVDAAAKINGSYDSVLNVEIDTKSFTYGGRIAVPYDEGTIVPEVKFIFKDNNFARVQLMNWGGSYIVKTVVSGLADKATSLNGANAVYANVLKENGGYIIVTIDSEAKALKVYLDNGTDGFKEVHTETIDWLENAVLEDVQVRKNDDTLSRTARFENNVLYTNCTDIAKFAANRTAHANIDDSMVCDGVDVSVGNVKVGEQSTVTVVAPAGIPVTVYADGVQLTAVTSDNGTYTFEYTAYYYNDITVIAIAPAELTVTVTAGGELEAVSYLEARPVSGGTAIRLDKGAENYTATLNGGEYAIWAISESGFARRIGTVQMNGNAVDETYVLTEANWTSGIRNITTEKEQLPGNWEHLYSDGDCDYKGNFAAALTLETTAQPSAGKIMEMSTQLTFSGNHSLRLDFRHTVDSNKFYMAIKIDGGGEVTFNNIQDKLSGAYSYFRSTGKLHVIVKVNGTDKSWAVYLWNGFEYVQMIDTNTSSGVAEKFKDIAWLNSEVFRTLDVKNSSGQLPDSLVKSYGVALATANSVDTLIASAPNEKAELTVELSMESDKLLPVGRLSVKVGNTEKDLTDGKILLAAGKYEIWAYAANGYGSKIGEVVMVGTAHTENITLNSSNWSSEVELTVNVSNPDNLLAVDKIVVIVNGEKKELTGNSITLGSGEYDVWLYAADGYGRKMQTVELVGEDKTVGITLTEENWGKVQGSNVHIAQSTGKGQETTVLGADTGEYFTANNFEGEVVYTVTGDITSNNFTAVAMFVFGNEKSIRVNLMKIYDGGKGYDYIKLEVQEQTGAGNSTTKVTKDTTVSSIAKFVGDNKFSIKVSVANGKVYVAACSGGMVFIDASYDTLNDYLGTDTALSKITARKTDDNGALTMDVAANVTPYGGESQTEIAGQTYKIVKSTGDGDLTTVLGVKESLAVSDFESEVLFSLEDTMTTTFTAVSSFAFANGKVLRVDFYRGTETWACLKIKKITESEQDVQVDLSAAQVAKLVTAGQFKIKVIAKDGAVYVSLIVDGEEQVHLSYGKLSTYLGGNTTLTQVKARKTDDNDTVTVGVSATVKALSGADAKWSEVQGKDVIISTYGGVGTETTIFGNTECVPVSDFTSTVTFSLDKTIASNANGKEYAAVTIFELANGQQLRFDLYKAAASEEWGQLQIKSPTGVSDVDMTNAGSLYASNAFALTVTVNNQSVMVTAKVGESVIATQTFALTGDYVSGDTTIKSIKVRQGSLGAEGVTMTVNAVVTPIDAEG